MANLGTWTINTGGEYKPVSDLTGVTFTEGETYTLQIMNLAYVREGTAGKGFCIFDNKPFQYTAGGDDLYVKTEGTCTLNISGAAADASSVQSTAAKAALNKLDASNILLSADKTIPADNTADLQTEQETESGVNNEI